jgi:uncharacterized protein (DUF1697 family)
MLAATSPLRIERTMTNDVHVALLRGINVGGRNMLPMKVLAAMFEEAGCRDVRTYIQSGNVVFRAGESLVKRVPAHITAVVANRFGIEVPVVTRSARDLRAVVRTNPFLRAGRDVARLHVAFLADRPGASRIARLDPRRSPPDEFIVHGREIYLHCPNGLGRTRLSNDYFDSTLATTCTVRNWRTVTTLLGMCGA